MLTFEVSVLAFPCFFSCFEIDTMILRKGKSVFASLNKRVAGRRADLGENPRNNTTVPKEHSVRCFDVGVLLNLFVLAAICPGQMCARSIRERGKVEGREKRRLQKRESHLNLAKPNPGFYSLVSHYWRLRSREL